mgnify:CR=1 FL=1
MRGFLDMAATLLTQFPAAEVCFAWDDDWRPDFRVQAIGSYKAHRVADGDADAEEVPDTLAPQVPVIAEVLEALGVARVGSPGFEADDVIGTLATGAAMPVDIVTGDRDLFQLVDDARGVRVVYTAKSVSRPDVYDQAMVAGK